MGCAIDSKYVIVQPTLAVREREVRGPHVSAVKDDDLVVGENLHVHRGDAYTRVEQNPVAGRYRCGKRGRNGEVRRSECEEIR